jgi:hypothetical protein
VTRTGSVKELRIYLHARIARAMLPSKVAWNKKRKVV